jgi:tetratricopeptide (TPR) repeat protein
MSYKFEESSDIRVVPISMGLPSLHKYIKSPNPENMFNLGHEYEQIGQTASAIGYYHKCAERTTNDGVAYEALLRISICYCTQTGRMAHEKNTLLMAIALQPRRPEAYFLICQLLERWGQSGNPERWWDSYTYACIAESNEKVLAFDDTPLKIDIGYPGGNFFIFQQAICLWWVGRFDESRAMLRHLDGGNHGFDEEYKAMIKSNIEALESNEGRIRK